MKSHFLEKINNDAWDICENIDEHSWRLCELAGVFKLIFNTVSWKFVQEMQISLTTLFALSL